MLCFSGLMCCLIIGIHIVRRFFPKDHQTVSQESPSLVICKCKCRRGLKTVEMEFEAAKGGNEAFSRIASEFGVPVERLRLVHKGAFVKPDCIVQLVSSNPGCVLGVIGSNEEPSLPGRYRRAPHLFREDIFQLFDSLRTQLQLLLSGKIDFGLSSLWGRISCAGYLVVPFFTTIIPRTEEQMRQDGERIQIQREQQNNRNSIGSVFVGSFFVDEMHRRRKWRWRWRESMLQGSETIGHCRRRWPCFIKKILVHLC